MFNEQEKNKYLSTLKEQTAKTIKCYFNSIISYEESLQKDIVFFTKEEYNDMLQKIGKFSKGKSLYAFTGGLKGYIEWYKENHDDYNVECDLVFIPNYKEITNSYYSSIEEMMDDIFLAVDEKIEQFDLSYSEKNRYINDFRMQYNISIGTLILSWYGLTVDEIRNLKAENISDTECKVYVDGRKEAVDIDEAAIFVLRMIKNASGYITFEGENNVARKVSFAHSCFFLKKYVHGRNPNEIVSCSMINNAINRLNKNSSGKTFLITIVRENGMFCRAYRKSKQIYGDQFKFHDNDEGYYEIFDEYVKSVSLNKFKDLKHKYKSFAKALEQE